MTGYTVHTGSTEKFSDGWDRIFSGKKKSGGKKKSTKSRSGKKTAKSAGKQKAKRSARKKS